MFLKNLIDSKWDEHGLDPINKVSSETIRSRVKRGCIDAVHPGTLPVLPENVEKIIADTVVAMAKIRNPLCVAEILALANTMIAKDKLREKVINWKKKNYPDLPSDLMMKLGKGWWRGFRKRFRGYLVVKRGEKFASDRSEWSKMIYIKQMFSEIYSIMIEAGIAVRLAKENYMNSFGEIVENEENNINDKYCYTDETLLLGVPTNVKITDPSYLLFFTRLVVIQTRKR